MPILGIGTSTIGDFFVNNPEAEVQQALNKAWELGIRYYDTAPWYGHGLREHRLGTLLRQHERKKYFIVPRLAVFINQLNVVRKNGYSG